MPKTVMASKGQAITGLPQLITINPVVETRLRNANEVSHIGSAETNSFCKLWPPIVHLM